MSSTPALAAETIRGQGGLTARYGRVAVLGLRPIADLLPGVLARVLGACAGSQEANAGARPPSTIAPAGDDRSTRAPAHRISAGL
jgi:hypothetical protein